MKIWDLKKNKKFMGKKLKFLNRKNFESFQYSRFYTISRSLFQFKQICDIDHLYLHLLCRKGQKVKRFSTFIVILKISNFCGVYLLFCLVVYKIFSPTGHNIAQLCNSGRMTAKQLTTNSHA